MADFRSDRFRGAQLLGNWLYGIGIAWFFIAACLVVIFLAIASQSNALVAVLSFMPVVSGIIGSVVGGLVFMWASFSLRIMIAIEHNTHVSSDVEMPWAKNRQEPNIVR